MISDGDSENDANHVYIYIYTFPLNGDVYTLAVLQTSGPFQHPDEWEEIARSLRNILEQSFSAQCVCERVSLLRSRCSENDRRKQNKKSKPGRSFYCMLQHKARWTLRERSFLAIAICRSGTVEEYRECDPLLQDMLSLTKGTSAKVRAARKLRTRAEPERARQS